MNKDDIIVQRLLVAKEEKKKDTRKEPILDDNEYVSMVDMISNDLKKAVNKSKAAYAKDPFTASKANPYLINAKKLYAFSKLLSTIKNLNDEVMRLRDYIQCIELDTLEDEDNEQMRSRIIDVNHAGDKIN